MAVLSKGGDMEIIIPLILTAVLFWASAFAFLNEENKASVAAFFLGMLLSWSIVVEMRIF